ncbi:MAG: radical SAM protein [Thermodesulfobacteriota bacterium]
MNTSVTRNKEAILRECSKKSLKVNNLPFYYHIHINMPCNQRCIMCKPDGKHSKDVLPFNEFVAFFEQIKPYAEQITLIGGEPLIYPWINEVIDLLSRHQIEVTINTNATMLNEKLSQKLSSLHGLNLKCSIDAVTPSTYFKIRGTDMFERVKANLVRFSYLAKNKPNIKQILVYVVMRENLSEVLPFIDFAKTLSPHRVEFHPVRHVTNWHTTNNTGWVFDGKEQSCEFFREEHNSMMRQAAAKCEKEGIPCETLLV